MREDSRRGTAVAHGRLWGSRARDWAEVQEGICRPVYEAVFDRIGVQPGISYLDVGCGAGMAAQIAASRGACVSGLDAAEQLLQIARSRVPDGDFRLGEMEDLPFHHDSFDIVTGFNSFQYAARPAVALKEAKRVAKPGAHVVIMTWGTPERMEWVSVLGALKSLTPPPPPDAPGPFALSEERAIRAFAESADLKADEVLDLDSPVHYPDYETAIRGLTSSGNAVRAMEQSSEEAVLRAYSDVLHRFRQPDRSYRIGARFRYLLARA
jgi:SAM-dependent methyltransferase